MSTDERPATPAEQDERLDALIDAHHVASGRYALDQDDPALTDADIAESWNNVERAEAALRSYVAEIRAAPAALRAAFVAGEEWRRMPYSVADDAAQAEAERRYPAGAAPAEVSPLVQKIREQQAQGGDEITAIMVSGAQPERQQGERAVWAEYEDGAEAQAPFLPLRPAPSAQQPHALRALLKRWLEWADTNAYEPLDGLIDDTRAALAGAPAVPPAAAPEVSDA